MLVVVGVGAIDLSTGPGYGFGFFYLIAVVPAAWLLGRWPGIAIGIASGFAWFFADLTEKRLGSLGPIVWNASSRLLLFALAAWLIDLVRREREHPRTLDRQRSHFMRVLEHELAGPGKELSRGLRALQQSGGATASELLPLVERAQDPEALHRSVGDRRPRGGHRARDREVRAESRHPPSPKASSAKPSWTSSTTRVARPSRGSCSRDR